MASINLNHILIFIDLDDTIFQTIRKNPNAKIPATESPNHLTVSYMSQEQNLFLGLLNANETALIIPVTARDYDQYKRTFISREDKIAYASIFFGAEILHKHESDVLWKSHVKSKLMSLSLKVADLKPVIERRLNAELYNIYNVNDYYLVIKHKDKSNYCEYNKSCFNMLKELIPYDYSYFINDNNITIVPKCIDKKNAVEYLIDKIKPKLTIGIGDSMSDWNFMDLCDFKIIPKNSQINRVINNNLFNYD